MVSYLFEGFKEYVHKRCMKNIAYDYIKYDNKKNTLLNEMITAGKCWMFTELACPQIEIALFPDDCSKNHNGQKQKE